MPTLGPRYGDQVPHPLNRQDIPKTTPFRRQKRRFLGGGRVQVEADQALYRVAARAAGSDSDGGVVLPKSATLKNHIKWCEVKISR